MKALVLLGLLSGFALPAFAGELPIAVRGEGSASAYADHAEELAKRNAVQDALQKCGSSPVVVAENLGWQIDTFPKPNGPSCTPHHFCSQEPDTISASAIFVCRGNLP